MVYLTSAGYGGLALIVTPGGEVTPVWLDDLNDFAARKMADGLYDVYFERFTVPKRFEENLLAVSKWLWEAVFGPLLPVLPRGGQLVLIPTHFLGLLPLAIASLDIPRGDDSDPPAGRRKSIVSRLLDILSAHRTRSNDQENRVYLCDLFGVVVVPNAAALRNAEASAQQSSDGSALVVDEPEPTGCAALRFSRAEAGVVRNFFPEVEVLPGEQATREKVIRSIRGQAVLHFSCHGRVRPDSVWAGGLVMSHDKLIAIADLVHQRSMGSRLALLSACEAAVSGRTLPDEVLGLPTMMQAAGIPAVIGPMWEVPSAGALMVTARFYDAWRREGRPPHEAFCVAQRWVRDSTNQEKVKLLAAVLPAEVADDPAVRELVKALENAPDAASFRHPMHWGAFTFVGS